MGRTTYTYTVQSPVDVPLWGASARTDAPVGRNGVAEILIPWGASVALSLTDEPDTSATISEYSQAHPQTVFVQVGFVDDRVVISAKGPQGRQGLLDHVTSGSEVVLDTIRLGAWLRIVRDGSRWGVQMLRPRGPGPYVSRSATVFEGGRAETTRCVDVVWVDDQLGSGDAFMQVWLQSETDSVHTIKSGLTGSPEFEDSTFWVGTTDVIASAASSTSGEAEPALSATARDFTFGEATPTGAAVARTLARSPLTAYLEADGATVSVARGMYVPERAQASTKVAGDVAAATSIAVRMPALTMNASSDASAGAVTSLPGLSLDARFLPVDEVESSAARVSTDIAPLRFSGVWLQRRRQGSVDAGLPPLQGSAAAEMVGSADLRLPPASLSAGVLESWRTTSVAYLSERWRMRRSFDMAVDDSFEAVDSATMQGAQQGVSEMSVTDELSWTADLVVGGESEVDLIDDMTFSTSAATDSADAVTWCVNTDTSASSRYERYGFNSYFQHDGAYYGVAEDGVYRLDGPDDAGVEIEGSVDLGVTDFKSDRNKYVPKAYFGGESSRPMHLQVIADGVSRTYRARAHSAEANLHRVDCGVGVKANYWRFTIRNSGGADFSVESFRVTPVTTRRRV